MANELHTFTGNEVIATELPELLNQNFDYVRENSLKSVNGVEKDENNNVDVTFLTNQVIPTNSNLNNFRESGEYTREVDTVVIANSPTEKPFFLTVLASENLVKQVVTEIDRKDPMTFTRTLNGANWSPWVEGGVDIGIWKSEETVKVGDVRFLKGRENAGYVLECVKAGVTGESQPVLEGDIAEEVFDLNNFDGTLSIEKGGTGASTVEGALEKLGLDKKLGFPVGYMYWSIEHTVPVGRLPALGATYNRSLYADLWAYANERGLVISESEWQAQASANNGNCAYYSSGDGSTTFRVPKLPTTIASDVPSEVPVVGNGMGIGLTEGTNYASVFTGGNPNALYTNTQMYASPIGGMTNSYTTLISDRVVGITTDETKSGIVAKTSATKITGQWFIVAFGVAHNIGEADVANVMQAVEQVQTSVGTLEQGVGTAVDYIIESYRNGTEWYEVYKSGKVRQGGYAKDVNNLVVTLLKPMADDKYTFSTANQSRSNFAGVRVGNQTTTQFKFTVISETNGNAWWTIEGQGA